MKKIVVLLPLLTMSLTGCWSGTPAVVSDGCAWAQPFCLHEGDQLTRQTKEGYVGYILTFEKNCPHVPNPCL